MSKKVGEINPREYACFVVDDGLTYWEEWGKRGPPGEDGLVHWATPERVVILPPWADYRTKLVSWRPWWSPFSVTEQYKVYRAQVGDLNGWSWGSLPGKRLDERVISRLVQGQYAKQELDYLRSDDSGVDLKKYVLLAGVVVVVGALFFFFVLPRLKGLNKAAVSPGVVAENVTQAQGVGHWSVSADNKTWTWVGS